MSKAFAWRPLALLPILKASACAETDKDWLFERRLDLYRRSMDHIIADLIELCSKDIYLRFADNLIRLSRAFYHLLVMDGAEVAAATMYVFKKIRYRIRYRIQYRIRYITFP